MSISSIDSVDVFLQGEKEPSGSWVFIVVGIVFSLSFLVDGTTNVSYDPVLAWNLIQSSICFPYSVHLVVLLILYPKLHHVAQTNSLKNLQYVLMLQ